MKKFLLIFFLMAIQAGAWAAHIAGGELQYKYLGPGTVAGSDRYQLTMRLFRECSSTGPQLINEVVNVGAYDLSTHTLVKSVTLPLIGGVNEIKLTENIPCLVGNPDVCYQVAIYTGEIELDRTPDGYMLAWGRCCRANGLINASGGGNIGATYVAMIPGTAVIGPQGTNSSPQFVLKDTALVCGGNEFILDFGASDNIDNDSLSYAFCDAYNFGSSGQTAPPPATLSLQSIPYTGYSGVQPLGPGVTIDPATGIISGIAPAVPGRYVVNVCVTEWRNGKPISEHRKDFILKVGDCNIIAAKLKPEYVNCTSYTSTFQNEANSSQINSYFWDFGVTTSTSDTANIAQPSFTYPDTGVYRITLIINRNEECSDTATSLVKVYPGFHPGFIFTGSCYQNPFVFSDTTKTAFGVVNSWRWDFGELTVTSDTSRIKNPSYTYPATTGPRQVTFIVRTDKGCSATIQKDVNVSNKPTLNLPFHDTLICSIDSLPLVANGNGIFRWTPNSRIINANTSNPVVFPQDTTVYYVELNENGCRNTDSIQVNVLQSIAVTLGGDTAICRTDSIRMNVTSHALSYSWSPAAGLSSTSVKYPMASPAATMEYKVRANLGKCEAKDSVVIRVSPYPLAHAPADTTVCFGDRVQLNATATAISYSWSPASSLLNPNTLNPVAGPSKTTGYILTATGYAECPKSVSDTVIVKVIPPVKAFAGNDTSITTGESLMLHASGGETYAWTPATHLSNAFIANPVIKVGNDIDTITYRVKVTTADGCSGSDDVRVVVFKTGPQVFVPGAFTPNNDGKNDKLYPVLVGMRQLNYFRVYNRYGQLVFSTSEQGKGWDGSFGGKEQPSGTFVYIAEAMDYKGVTVVAKGSVVLIR